MEVHLRKLKQREKDELMLRKRDEGGSRAVALKAFTKRDLVFAFRTWRVSAWRVHGACAACVRCVCRVYALCARCVHGVCACAWRVHGACLHGVCAVCARRVSTPPLRVAEPREKEAVRGAMGAAHAGVLVPHRARPPVEQAALGTGLGAAAGA